MKILHYTLGFPPLRSGGLVAYANDIMQEQINKGHTVYALYPANQFIFSKRPFVKLANMESGIQTYHLFNSLPLALFGGIQNPDDFMYPCHKEDYERFLKELQPDIIHIHSLMGLHKEFFQVAKKLGISLIFTTHDYYGLAPLPSFYYNEHSFDANNTNLAWNIMSADALSTKKLRLFQSHFYPTIRHLLKLIRRNPKHVEQRNYLTIEEKIDYSRLKNYYRDIFSLIDKFHFNSSLARTVYERNLGSLPGQVLSITTKQIKKINLPRVKHNKIHIAYIGPDEFYKGYFDFLSFISNLDTDKFECYSYGHYPNEMAPEYLHQMGRFKQDELAKVYQNIDILIVPSHWKETFGLVVLEALSYGLTVYASDMVGAKDLLPNTCVFSCLLDLIDNLEIQTEGTDIKNLEQHIKELDLLYQSI